MPRKLGQRAGLSRKRVIAVARDLASEGGLDKLTIRSLADRLDVAPNAVYGWVESKSALLDALVDDALSDAADAERALGLEADPADPGGALNALNTLLLDVFDAIMSRPALAPLFLDRATSPGPNATRIRGRVLTLLVNHGTSENDAAAAVPVLLVHVMGFAAFVSQTHGARLLDGPHLGTPRDIVARGLEWLLAGVASSTTSREPSDEHPVSS